VTAAHEELAAANAAIGELLAAGAEDRLRALPGVIHVSVGLKETGGTVTDRLAIRVYVEEKKATADVPPAELIPASVDGVPTDVNVVGTYDFTMDNGRYRPVEGGIQVTNRIIGLNDAGTGTQIAAGTLGCIATYDADRSPVLLGNWHVLMANSARTGDRIFQPAPSVLPPVDETDLPLRPADDADAVAKILDSRITDKVDGAIARIDVSSWCRCCGTDYRNEINGLSVDGHPPKNVISGRRAAVAGETVYKVGMHTGRTVGHVVDANFPSFSITRGVTTFTFTGQIQISSADATSRFSETGDSGSVVIGEDNFVVGLLFASDTQDPPSDRSFANHVADVCSALGITINFTTAADDHAGALLAVPSAPNVGADAYRAVRERLLREPSGAWLLELAEAHREEIVHLVNDDRRVTVAWHRAGGPALFAAVLNALRAGEEALPARERGVDAAEVLARMGEVLSVHGSPVLREAVEQHGPAVLAAVRGSERLDELLEQLNAHVPVHA
jgi:hypothetical protein